MPRRARVTANEIRGPRLYLLKPEQFGVTTSPKPAAHEPSQEPIVRAALQQHSLARHAVERINRDPELTYDNVANRLDITTEQLRRLLRGESAMTFTRMHQLAKAVGLRITLGFEVIPKLRGDEQGSKSR